MNPDSNASRNRRARLALGAFIVVVLLALAAWLLRDRLREFIDPPAPEVPQDWSALVQDIKAYQRRIGFRDTPNFTRLVGPQKSLVFCGVASQRVLPWSYQDPAIRWPAADTLAQCIEAAGPEADAYFGDAEAVGEIGMQVTPSMLASRLGRFVYLIIHEDCHDQFELPFGVEEGLCDVLAYRGMIAWAAEKFPRFSREYRAIRRYADQQIALSLPTVEHYQQVAALYARLDRNEIGLEALLVERKAIYASAMRALDWQLGEMNNVSMANYMTYSRHYPYLDSVHAALGGDPARTLAFFKGVDKAKPEQLEVVKRRQLADMHGVAFVRAWETEVLETAARLLASAARP